jgi:hypothetical protein
MFRFERDRSKQASERAFKPELAIRFQDVDAGGIIFYPRASHDAYVAFLDQAGLPLHGYCKDPGSRRSGTRKPPT